MSQVAHRDVFVSSPDLRPSLRGILRVFQEAELLAGIATTVAVDPTRWPFTWVRAIAGPGFERRLANRVVPQPLRGSVTAFWGREVARVAASRFAGPVMGHKVWAWAESGFDRAVAARYAGKFRCMYGMEHSSLATFHAQKDAGGLCVLRQVTAHGSVIARILRRTAERHPEHVGTYYATVLREMEQTVTRKSAECQLADLIVGNSEFVYRSFVEEGLDPSRVAYVPTGCPAVAGEAARAGRGRDRLRFLFLGTLSLRKGLLELLDAWRMSGAGSHADLWLAGAAELDPGQLIKGTEGVTYLGNVPRARVDELIRSVDVFVLPTLVEGLAHSLLEALSAGLPIVTTPASGCGSFVENGVNGVLLEDADVAGISDALTWCLAHRALLPAMGARSRDKAARWTVADSNRAHLELMQEFLSAGRAPMAAAGGRRG